MFILLHGPDEFLAHEELDRIKADPEVAYNIDTYNGMESSLQEILASCDTLPFFSARRLVVVERLPKPRRKETESSTIPAKQRRQGALDRASFTEALARYVPMMPESTVLVVMAGEALEATSPLVKAARSYGRVQSSASPRGAELEEWLMRRTRAEERELTREAAHFLVQNTDDNLRSLVAELDKLATYVGRGGRIGIDEVQRLTAVSQNARVFDLTDALARRDRIRGLALLHELLGSGESPIGIVALAAGQTRSLIQVKLLAERGLRSAAIAQATGMAPFLAQKLVPLAGQFSLAQLEATHRRLRDIDYALKRSKMTPDMALDLLVIEFGTVAV